MPVTDNNFVAARPGTALQYAAALVKPVSFFIIARSASLAAGAGQVITGPQQAPVTTVPYEMRTAEAINTTPVTIVGAYETLPL